MQALLLLPMSGIQVVHSPEDGPGTKGWRRCRSAAPVLGQEGLAPAYSQVHLRGLLLGSTTYDWQGGGAVAL